MNDLWKKYDDMTLQCYLDSLKNEPCQQHWDDAYQTLEEIFVKAKEEAPDTMTDLSKLENAMDYRYDLCGRINEYLDFLMELHAFQKAADVCQFIIETFEWKEDNPAELRYRLAASMAAQKKVAEAVLYCKVWHEEDPENPAAASALVEMLTLTEQYGLAEKILQKFVGEETVCDAATEPLFGVASYLYERSGDADKKASVDRRMTDYAKKVETSMERIFNEPLPF